MNSAPSAQTVKSGGIAPASLSRCRCRIDKSKIACDSPMNGQDFVRLVNTAFSPFLRELGFSPDPFAISGRFYRASFTGPLHSVSVSFEPGDNAFFVLVFTREGRRLSDIDDRLKTPRLSDLNRRYMNTVTDEERAANEDAFAGLEPADDEEAALIRYAKELRLVLPKYLAGNASKT
jgi:hypothetical protein